MAVSFGGAAGAGAPLALETTARGAELRRPSRTTVHIFRRARAGKKRKTEPLALAMAWDVRTCVSPVRAQASGAIAASATSPPPARSSVRDDAQQRSRTAAASLGKLAGTLTAPSLMDATALTGSASVASRRVVRSTRLSRSRVARPIHEPSSSSWSPSGQNSGVRRRSAAQALRSTTMRWKPGCPSRSRRAPSSTRGGAPLDA